MVDEPAGVQPLTAHVTVPVSGCVVPLLSSSKATRFVVLPTARVGLAGVTFKPVTTEPPTVKTAFGLVTPSSTALIFVVPPASAVANPVLSIVAVVILDEFHVTELVMGTMLVEPSLFRNVPVAV
jgi:hypothetical protein